MKKTLDLVMSLVMLVSIFFVSFFHGISAGAAEDTITIVVDAGHGGIDPGKIGINKTKEKDLNLIIAKKIASQLTTAGYKVIMTRTDDSGLYSEDDINKKATDLKKRCEIAMESNADLYISIHQNSFSSESVKGGQVFFYTHSVEGKKAADYVQQALKETVDSTNTRSAKANDSYYLLVHTPCPTIIVECGFLSNRLEADKLTTDEYQNQIAEAIVQGINKFFNK